MDLHRYRKYCTVPTLEDDRHHTVRFSLNAAGYSTSTVCCVRPRASQPVGQVDGQPLNNNTRVINFNRGLFYALNDISTILRANWVIVLCAKKAH